jgi:uncharacterized protein (DUF2141 family)
VSLRWHLQHKSSLVLNYVVIFVKIDDLMKKVFINSLLLLLICLLLSQCANRGTPSGGDKDITPPIITQSIPENYSTNFKASEIKIFFDEYVKIKDLKKQLIVSPPMDPEPQITPLGTASKYITIQIFDTLQSNTTYAFNFGESIVDNNESNPYPYYRYVFSTGTYIDSLKVNGVIEDALNEKPDDFVSVMLYEMDSTFSDSIVYKKKPNYITNTLDSTAQFQLDNLKAGQYFLVALKDNNDNFTFQQKEDKIGFKKDIIAVPSDSSYSVKLFKEIFNFKATRPSLVSGNKIAFGYEGDYENMNINIVSDVPKDFQHSIVKDSKSDSLYYYFTPDIKRDSLVFKVSNNTYVDTLTVRLKTLEKDSLTISTVNQSTLKLTEDFVLTANIPFARIDESKIKILDKDSVNINFTNSYESLTNNYRFKFDKQEESSYKIQLLPNALEDLFGRANDTLSYNLRTRAVSDYGNLRLTIGNAIYPLIVQLVTPQGKVKDEKYTTKPEPLDFIHIDAAKYLIRVIYDKNQNRTYDTGNYLKKRQPERVSYYPSVLDIRKGWDYVENFILK